MPDRNRAGHSSSTRVLSGEVTAKTENGVLTLTQRSRVIDFIGVKRPLTD